MEANSIGATEATQQSIFADMEALILLRRMVKVMESQQVVDSAGRQRVTVDAGLLPNVTVVGTVSNITAGNISQLDSYRAYELFALQAKQAFNTGIRGNIV